MTTHIENGYRALQTFAAHMTKVQQISDGLLTARVIGEFSAGKTRFLRELLGDSIPPALYPISSLERQTRLPLEITYGPEPELTLVQRANDYEINDKTLTLQTLTEFPDREATLQHKPSKHRLRLAIPEDRLILKNGDGYFEDKSAKRLFLIDMPGWNSGDDLLAEGDASEVMAGVHNLALVYVVSAVRLDGLKNSERLNNFLKAFSDADFVGAPHLIVVMTHCPAAEANALQAKVKKQVNAMWAELGEASPLSMALFSIDFEEVSPAELGTFRDEFWQSLLSPLGHPVGASVQHPWVHALRSWPKHWLLDEPVAQTHALLTQARAVLQAASQEKNYLVGMNMTKLGGLDTPAIKKRLKEAWSRQMRDTAAAVNKPLHQCIPILDEKHPLAAWWGTYWEPHLQCALQPVGDFLEAVSGALSQVSPNTSDLQTHLSQRLDASYHQAVQAVHSSFTQVVDSLQKLPEKTQPEQTLATLLRLSLLQMRYQDYLEGRVEAAVG
ncbi:MAG: dynamin family protein [Polaromonas sp.]